METVSLDDKNSALVIIDQTKLPGSLELISLKTPLEIYGAIKELKVRGAPAIGIAAAMGLYLSAKSIEETEFDPFFKKLAGASAFLASSRPTAVNLRWALSRMEASANAAKNLPVPEIKRRLKLEAQKIKDEDEEICRKIGENGLALIKPGDGILTHCNAGALATAKFGTALSPVYLAQERGYNLRVYADETRPLLQGARLTAFELMSAGVDVTLICDGMASFVMKSGRVQAVFTGCDRVAANGDAANKIGTSGVAVLANYYKIPFYICAPLSTIDLSCPDGGKIPIEERPAEEVTEMWYKKRMAPEGVKVLNPAFDVTDASLVSGIVTERGILRPPYIKTIAEIFQK
ncbi:MAG: S-methyl-5-thioribose-1-phosphate isomerase [Bacillota bacterium]|nr:S-methyl-5-thioribose-1-phosphate isomerase [Bacillota bacterium]